MQIDALLDCGNVFLSFFLILSHNGTNQVPDLVL